MIDAYDPAQAAMDCDFVQAAYDMFASDESDLTPDPSGHIPPGWSFVAWIKMSDFCLWMHTPRFYGFIARCDADSDAHIIALRGTKDWMEWYDDFSVFKVPFAQAPDAGRVSHGFDSIYTTLHVHRPPIGHEVAVRMGSRPSVILPGTFGEQVAQILRERPAKAGSKGPSLVVTGHSLGAALSTLFVMEHFRKPNPAVHRFCSIASPRVGDGRFVAVFNALKITSWRIFNKQDIVPQMPLAMLGFEHVNEPHEYDSHGKVRWSPVCWHAIDTYIALIRDRPVTGTCALTAEHRALLQQQ